TSSTARAEEQEEEFSCEVEENEEDAFHPMRSSGAPTTSSSRREIKLGSSLSASAALAQFRRESAAEQLQTGAQGSRSVSSSLVVRGQGACASTRGTKHWHHLALVTDEAAAKKERDRASGSGRDDEKESNSARRVDRHDIHPPASREPKLELPLKSSDTTQIKNPSDHLLMHCSDLDAATLFDLGLIDDDNDGFKTVVSKSKRKPKTPKTTVHSKNKTAAGGACASGSCTTTSTPGGPGLGGSSSARSAAGKNAGGKNLTFHNKDRTNLRDANKDRTKYLSGDDLVRKETRLEGTIVKFLHVSQSSLMIKPQSLFRHHVVGRKEWFLSEQDRNRVYNKGDFVSFALSHNPQPKEHKWEQFVAVELRFEKPAAVRSCTTAGENPSPANSCSVVTTPASWSGKGACRAGDSVNTPSTMVTSTNSPPSCQHGEKLITTRSEQMKLQMMQHNTTTDTVGSAQPEFVPGEVARRGSQKTTEKKLDEDHGPPQ
ncbi:unnamed protein product, partial [Amoebophrya sp. A120]